MLHTNSPTNLEGQFFCTELFIYCYSDISHTQPYYSKKKIGDPEPHFILVPLLHPHLYGEPNQHIFFNKEKGGQFIFLFINQQCKETTRLNKTLSSGHFILTSFTGREQGSLSSTSTHIGHLLSEDWGLYIRSTFCSLCNACLLPKKKVLGIEFSCTPYRIS